ncbi:hypothetical protein EDD15DRAFT_2363117 [Pisolithus albus]|nr:hypothetical protein EDD15DRAFT_2363117 [Pisolithus albus]
MADTEYCWVVIGGDGGAHIYGSEDCPFIACGRQTPALPLAIQCRSSMEARNVARTLQPIADSLPHGVDHTQMLAAFDIPSVRTLLEDGDDFYAIIIGSPPGIYRTSEGAARAEGTFKYRIRRQTTSFWTALAFMLVKGVAQRMPPMLTYKEMGEIPSKTTTDSLAERLHHSLTLSSCSSQVPSTPSQASSSTSASTLFRTSSASHGTPTPPLTSPSRPESATSPIIYSHVRNLRGIISSNYYPTSTTHIRNLAQPLGQLAARYLASHGYGTEDVECILQAKRRARNSEDLVAFLAGRGMSVNEARFLLQLVDQRDTLHT